MRSVAIALAALLLITNTQALAQTYPAKALRLIIPFAPGGGSDILGRIVGQKLTE